MSIASKAATPHVNQEIGGPMEATADAVASPFEPCVWGDFFVNYTAPISQRSEEWMKERADQLKREVQRMFEVGNAMSVADTVTLVDALERLGIDNHFLEDINAALSRVHKKDLEFGSSKELHIVALRFRLLRQHGFWVSADVFDKFRDGTSNFITCLSGDPRGLLSLYNAAHMAMPDEDVLDEAIIFAKSHLEAMKGSLKSPMVDQVSRALKIPLPRFMGPLETMHYITEYEQEEAHNAMVLELARLNYNITRSLHLKELKAFSLWWRDLYKDVKLTYARDRGVEMYFWAFGIFLGHERNSRGRIIFSKIIALASLLDDTYDVHAVLEDSKKFDEALQRWDESAVSILPEYLHMLYIKTLRTFSECEDILELDEKYRVSYVQEAFVLLSKYYLQEAKWSNENYMPSFKDQVDLSFLSSGLPMLILATLMAAGHEATKEALEWASGVPDTVLACGEVARLLNDISAYKRKRKNKMDVASSLECYMKEYGTTAEEAAAALTVMIEQAWRRMNRACMEIDRALLPAVQLAVINQARASEVLYSGGNDIYTFSGDLKGIVTSLFLKPVPL